MHTATLMRPGGCFIMSTYSCPRAALPLRKRAFLLAVPRELYSILKPPVKNRGPFVLSNNGSPQKWLLLLAGTKTKRLVHIRAASNIHCPCVTLHPLLCVAPSGRNIERSELRWCVRMFPIQNSRRINPHSAVIFIHLSPWVSIFHQCRPPCMV